MNNNCPFCSGVDPLFENELCYVTLDRFPVSKGHCLIIPKRHFESYFDSTKNEVDSIHNLILETKDYLDEEFHPDSYNIGINCGEEGGQTIFHTHIHIIPRYKGDVDDPRGGVRGIIPGKQQY